MRIKKKVFRKLLYICLSAVILIVLIGSICYTVVGNSTNGRIITIDSCMNKPKVALVLGTSKLTKRGNLNPFFTTRIKKAAELYLAGCIEHIIVSGDNSVVGYNETEDMRDALMALGVQEKDIAMDYAGFRTLDSVIRCKAIFDVSEVVIVSQRFHVERALYQAEVHNINAYAAIAENPIISNRLKAREILARVKAIIDLHIINKEPKFYGPKISF